jgi:hypothetical protein
MAHYLVRARLKNDLAEELRSRLESGEIRSMRPFGTSLHRGLTEARLDPETGETVWEEEDYCSPPLAQEREAVLDRYFEGLSVEAVQEDEGWSRIKDFPGIW